MRISTASVRIRVIAADPAHHGMRFNPYVGEEFEALGLTDRQYMINLDEVARRGTIPVNSTGGGAYVPHAFAEPVEPRWPGDGGADDRFRRVWHRLPRAYPGALLRFLILPIRLGG